MANRKEYELLLSLKAALGGNFNSTFSNAINTTKKLQNTLTDVKKIQSNISGYQKTQQAITDTKNRVDELGRRHTDLQGKLAATVVKEKELIKSLEKSAKATGTETEEYKRLEAELSKTRSEKEQFTGQIKKNAAEIEKAKNKIVEEEKKLADLTKQLQTAGINTDKLTQENDKLTKAYDRVKKSQEGLSRVNKQIEENKAAISATKSELTKTLGVIGAVGTALYLGPVKKAVDFEAQMASVNAIAGVTQEEFVALSAKAKEMGAATKFTAVEAGQAMEYMAMAGWKSEQMLAGIEPIMTLAAASGEDLALVSDIVTDAITAFGLKAGDAGHFADVLAASSAASNTNVAMLGESFKYAAPLAGAFGFSIEDTGLALGLMANAGIKASQGGTSLRKIFTALSSDFEILQKDGTKFTVMTQNTDGTMRDLKSIIDDVRKGFNGMTQAEIEAAQSGLIDTAKSLAIELSNDNGELKTQAELYADVQDAIQGLTDAGKVQEAESIAGKTAMAGLLSIVNASEDDYNKLADAIYDAAGEAERMRDIKLDTFEGQMYLMTSAFDGLQMTIGEMFVPMLTQGLTKLTEFITKVDDFTKANPELVKTLGAVVAGLAAVKVGSLAGKLGFLELEKGVLKIVKGFLGFKAKLAEMGTETITGSGKIAGMGKSLTGYFNGAKNSIGGLGGSIDKLAGGKLSGVFSKIGGGLQSGLLKPLGEIKNKVTGALGGAGSKITGLFGDIGKKIANGPLGKIGGVFKSVGSTAGSVLGGPLKGLGSLFGGLFSKAMPVILILSALSILFMKLSGEDISSFIEPLKEAFEQIKPVLQSVMEQFMELGKQLMPVLIDTAKKLAPLLGQIITGILPIIIEIIQQLVPMLVQIIGDILPVVLNIIGELAPLLADVITAILPILLDLVKMLLPIITQLVKDVLPIIAQVLNTLMPIIKQLIEAVLPVLMSILQALMPVIQVLASIFSEVLGTAVKSVSDIIGGVMKILGGLIDFVTGIFTGNWKQAWEGVKTIFGGIFETLGALVKTPINAIISVINGAIKGINKLNLTIPDWVPLLGGKGFKINIPEIPLLYRGSPNTPDTFIAGDRGPELITGAAGRKVFTAAQTGDIFKNLQTVFSTRKPESVSTPTVSVTASRGGGGITLKIENNPVIHVGGDKPNDLEAKLKAAYEYLTNLIMERLRKEKEDEGRMEYA